MFFIIFWESTRLDGIYFDNDWTLPCQYKTGSQKTVQADRSNNPKKAWSPEGGPEEVRVTHNSRSTPYRLSWWRDMGETVSSVISQPYLHALEGIKWPPNVEGRLTFLYVSIDMTESDDTVAEKSLRVISEQEKINKRRKIFFTSSILIEPL